MDVHGGGCFLIIHVEPGEGEEGVEELSLIIGVALEDGLGHVIIKLLEGGGVVEGDEDAGDADVFIIHGFAGGGAAGGEGGVALGDDGAEGLQGAQVADADDGLGQVLVDEVDVALVRFFDFAEAAVAVGEDDEDAALILGGEGAGILVDGVAEIEDGGDGHLWVGAVDRKENHGVFLKVWIELGDDLHLFSLGDALANERGDLVFEIFSLLGIHAEFDDAGDDGRIWRVEIGENNRNLRFIKECGVFWWQLLEIFVKNNERSSMISRKTLIHFVEVGDIFFGEV